MQKPIYFENEIVQPKNLDFLNASMEKNVKDVVTLLTDGGPGIASGLTLTGISGNNYFTVSSGYGFIGDGDRIELFSGTNVNIAFTGTQPVFAKLNQVVYNPNPSENPAGAANVVTNVDPTDNQLVAVESYNAGEVSTTSGTGYITIGTVTADSSMKFITASASGAQYISIAGIINLNNNTINGVNIGSGTIDSNAFTTPLSFDITLGANVDILLTGSGNNNLGSASNPFANISAVTGNFHELTGMSPILTDSFWQKSGTSLEATGVNTVQIDRNQLGTQFGRGITLNNNSISTVGVDKDINVTTDPLKAINLNSTVNIGSGHDIYIKDNIHVSGQAFFNSTNITSVTGNFTVNGAIAFSSTNEITDNLVKNSNFATPSGNITGTVTYPANWRVTSANQDFAYGPLTNANEYAFSSVALNNAMNVMGTTGNYTIEGNIKKFGNSLFGDNINQIWTKFGPIATNGGNFYIKTNGALATFQNSVELASPAVILNNQWYHVAYTWNGTQRKLWIDGVNVATDSTVGNFVTTTTQSIAAFGASSRNFNGLVNNLRFSNIARSSFPSGSAAPIGGADFNTFGLWKFENNFLDSSINGFTLNLNGAATGTFTDTGLGQVFSGTVANTGTDSALAPLTQNVYVGAPHTTNWILCSGSNLDSTGTIISQPLPDLKPNTSYNLSFFQKGFSNFSGTAINPSISGSNVVSGTPVITALTASPNLITSNQWTRQNFGFVSNASGNNFNLNLNVMTPTGVIAANGIFGITAVQITEGPALVPYNKQNNMQVIPISMPADFGVAVNAGVNPQPVVPGLGRTFFTKGGQCVINANLGVAAQRISASLGQDVTYETQLILDGKLISVAPNYIPYGIANSSPANYLMSGQGAHSYGTYLEPGFHTLIVRFSMSSGGGAGTGYWNYYVFASPRSNISITIFE